MVRSSVLFPAPFAPMMETIWPVAMDAGAFEKPDWMLLSYHKPVTVSSGEGAGNVTDEDIRTFWKAGSNDAGEFVILDLEKKAGSSGGSD